MTKRPKNGGGEGSSSSPPLGGGPSGSSLSAEQQELAKAAVAHAVAVNAALLKQLFPHVPDARVMSAAQKITLETAALREQVLPSILGSGGANDTDPNPYWGVKIHGPVGISMIHVPKKLPKDASTDTAFQYASAMGLLMDPLMKGCLLLSGLRYEFFQTRTPPPGAAHKPSGIIV